MHELVWIKFNIYLLYKIRTILAIKAKKISSTLSLTSALDGVGGQCPACFIPGKEPGPHCIGGWVGPRDALDRCGKYHTPPGFDPRNVQPVANRYTDWAIPAHTGLAIAKIIRIYVLFVLYRSMYCLCVNVYYCHRVTTQLQLINISYIIYLTESTLRSLQISVG